MIIFLYGQDSYRSKEKLKELIQKFKEKRDNKGLNVTKLEGEGLTIDEFRKAVLSAGLFSKKRLVVIENLISQNKDQELLEEVIDFLKKERSGENILIFYEIEEPQKNSLNQKLFSLLEKEKYAQEFSPLEKRVLKNWVFKEVKKKGGEISTEAIDFLAEYFGPDLWRLSSEIDKLLSYGQGEIETKTLEIISEKKEEEETFALIDALINKNKKKAIKLLENELERDTPFSRLLFLMAAQFRIIFQVKERKTSGVYQLAKELGVHPYPVKKAIEQAKKYDLEELKKIYQELLKIDLQLKTTGLKPELLFDLLVAKL